MGLIMKEHFFLNIINTLMTLIIGYLIYGFVGLFISMIPDIFLIVLIPDFRYGKNKDRLVGFWLFGHYLTHSIFPSLIFLFIDYKISIILFCHITHKKEQKFFKGYFMFYPITTIGAIKK